MHLGHVLGTGDGVGNGQARVAFLVRNSGDGDSGLFAVGQAAFSEGNFCLAGAVVICHKGLVDGLASFVGKGVGEHGAFGGCCGFCSLLLGSSLFDFSFSFDFFTDQGDDAFLLMHLGHVLGTGDGVGNGQARVAFLVRNSGDGDSGLFAVGQAAFSEGNFCLAGAVVICHNGLVDGLAGFIGKGVSEHGFFGGLGGPGLSAGHTGHCHHQKHNDCKYLFHFLLPSLFHSFPFQSDDLLSCRDAATKE